MVIKGSVHSEFSYLPRIKCVFLTDLRNKTMTCFCSTFSVRPTIPESKNVAVTMKKSNEKENEDFCEEEYFNFEELSSVKKNIFEKFLCKIMYL